MTDPTKLSGFITEITGTNLLRPPDFGAQEPGATGFVTYLGSSFDYEDPPVKPEDDKPFLQP